MLVILGILLALQCFQIRATVGSGDACETNFTDPQKQNATRLILDSEKVTLEVNNSGSNHFVFDVVDEDLSISVTPIDRHSDPDVRLYGEGKHSRLRRLQYGPIPNVPNLSKISTPSQVFGSVGGNVGMVGVNYGKYLNPLHNVGKCTLLVDAQDYGGDFIAVPGKVRSTWSLRQKIERMYMEFDPGSQDLLHLNETINETAGGEAALYKQLVTKYGEPAKNGSWEVVRYHLHISCPLLQCEYHLAIGVGAHAFEQEEIKNGETKSGMTFHGVQHHFFFKCGEECATSGDEADQRITFSAWPRDATSDELELLVQKDTRPTTITGQHMLANKGWFGGRVVTHKAEKGTYYITVMKKYGKTALPFVLSVNLPKTLQELVLGRPIFGATSPGSPAYYRFEVKKPDTDIEVYLTSISGDADLFLSHSSVDKYPRLDHAQWSAKKVGDDEIIVKADDSQRKRNATGWFHIGVRGYRTSAFSLIVLAEEAEAPGKNIEVITWTELWLGLPQALSAEPGRPTSFIFYSQLHSKNIYLHLQTLQGDRPEVCMQSCGADPHDCPYISSLTDAGKQMPDNAAVSGCMGIRMDALSHLSVEQLRNPCSACWYSILVTSRTAKSRFRITLSADGTAQPLIVGEPFKGYVNRLDTPVLLVYYLSNETMQKHLKGTSTLRISLTAMFGDPEFSITKGPSPDTQYIYKYSGACAGGIYNRTTLVAGPDEKSAADQCFAQMQAIAGTYFSLSLEKKQCGIYFGICSSGDDRTEYKTYQNAVLFNSQTHSRYDFEMKLRSQQAGLDAVGSYFIRVWAASKHSKYRIQAFWEHPLEHAHLQVAPSIDGLPFLEDGRMIRGALVNGAPDVYLFKLSATEHQPRPDIAVTVTALDKMNCHIAATVVKPDMNTQAILNAILQGGDQVESIWRTSPGEQLLNILHTDPQYSAPVGDDSVYAIAVLPAVAGISGRLEYQIEAFSSDKTIELVANGIPLAGQVVVGVRRKYKVVLLEAQNLAVSLTVLSGDANLYLGVFDDVSDHDYEKASTVIGSDSLFIAKTDDLMQGTCQKAINQNHECSFFIAVYGMSGLTDYRISAVLPSDMPVLLAPSSKAPVILVPGAHQHFYFRLEQHYGKTVQVILDSGNVRSLSAIVVDIGDAEHPASPTIRKFIDGSGLPDINATHFAGVWSLRFSTSRMAQLCKQFGETSCAAFIDVHAHHALEGNVVLIEDPHPLVLAPSPTDGGVPAPTPSDPSADSAVPLEIGMPARAELKAGRQVLFSLNVQEDKHDISLSVSPFGGNCKPRVQVEFPAENSNECHTILNSESPLGYISETISATHPCFREGVFLFKLETKGSMDCDVDFRVMLLSRTHQDKQVSVLMLDSPVLVSDNRTRLLLFMSRVESEQKANDRERLTVKITAFTDDLNVSAVYVTARNFSHSTSKQERLSQLLQNMDPIRPQRSEGAPSEFSIHNFNDGKNCGTELVCQVIVKISASKVGRFFDCLAVATDDVDRHNGAETLVPGMPLKGWIDPSQRKPLQYQIFVNNPQGVLRIRVACTDDNEASCGSLHVSADARLDFPQHQAQRAYNIDGTEGKRMIELVVTPSVGIVSPGACKVPCVLTVRVEVAKGAPVSTGIVNFMLTATQDSDYTLLLDGYDPVEATAKTADPVYFLFDSRRSSPLLSIVVTLPHDSSDPLGELVNVWGLGCDSANGKSSEHPSRENHDFQGFPNPHNQKVALVEHSRTNHCYYRIAVKSHRLNPMTFSIRGFDWHDMSLLPLGEPLNGIVTGARSFSYFLDTPALQSVALSMEVCHGNVLLETSPTAESPTNKVHSGFEALVMPVQDARWLKISSDSEGASYILTAEKLASRRWLGLPHAGDSDLVVDQWNANEHSMRVRWQTALLYGAGLPYEGLGDDADPEAWYEVFYLREDDKGTINISSPCGLYEAERLGKAKKQFVKSSREAVLDLKPAVTYYINVVARSTRSGSSFAYTPYRSISFVKELEEIKKESEAREETTGEYWLEDAAPLFVITLVIACCCWARPCCKDDGSGIFDIELPRYNGGGSRARDYISVASNTGSYAPPSIVGGS